MSTSVIDVLYKLKSFMILLKIISVRFFTCLKSWGDSFYRCLMPAAIVPLADKLFAFFISLLVFSFWSCSSFTSCFEPHLAPDLSQKQKFSDPFYTNGNTVHFSSFLLFNPNPFLLSTVHLQSLRYGSHQSIWLLATCLLR